MSESLTRKGGREWSNWRARMDANWTRVQGGDGDWAGHCRITGWASVTSAAPLVLITDVPSRSAQERLLGKEAC